MEKTIGKEKTTQLARYQNTALITRSIANEIVNTLWGSAPAVEKTKAILYCVNYNLNPLMNHIFLIKYDRYKVIKGVRTKIGEDWALVQGIKATRLLARRNHNFTYLDMTPRIATQDEITQMLGTNYYPDHVYAITHIQDLETKAEAWGIKGRPANEAVKGQEKGNTPLNMACIQSERQAMERLYPAEMPAGMTVIDENFVDYKVTKDVIVEETEEESEEQAEGKTETTDEKKSSKESTAAAAGTKTDADPDGIFNDPLKIDIEWLKASLVEIQWRDVREHLREKYGIQFEKGTKAIDMVKHLNIPQQEEFCAEVQKRLDEVRASAGQQS